MKMPVDLIPDNMMDLYNLHNKIKMDLFTYKFNVASIAFHNQAYWTTNFFAND